ncbi:hypothetical protein HD553DRAFT_306053 [Filobasidium floriforme]|uniref:uncharacterized protein n=1 Tax=Filobasidium floriforme TaxID=5210 RepID=UPI001E8E5D96|nr:uncharacterized protein HD553DRAFT_306053 [Filobasidium floriforme]KAH8088283.1 hypothetical protein HD553DRAFT_306053 [Filobasidium floriforme]
MTKQSLKKLPAVQAIQALRVGAGAETLPSSVRGVVLSYVANLEERGVKQFTSTTLPRLAYSNPTVKFHVDRKPSSRTKAKDPEIQERATKAAEEESKGSKEKAERRTPRMTIEFAEGTSKMIDLTGMKSSNILQAIQAAQA